MLGREAVTEAQFTEKSGMKKIKYSIANACNFVFFADDISSISGSDTEKDDMLDNIAAAQGKIFIQNSKGQVFSMYKCLLADKKVQ